MVTKKRFRPKQTSNFFPCPVCGTRCSSVRSSQVTELYREVVYQCRNDGDEGCNLMFVASITPVRVLFPSNIPDADAKLPAMITPSAARKPPVHARGP